LKKVALFLNQNYFTNVWIRIRLNQIICGKEHLHRFFQMLKKLRENQTEAEEKLWLAVKNNQIEGYKFRRQHPLSIYIADFYCHALKLVIEIDGGYHLNEEQRLLVEKRTSDIEFQRSKVIRFTNEEIC
jgi:very-short-patch-repair endonuclease